MKPMEEYKMRQIVRCLVVASFALTVLPAAGFADEKKDLYDCGEPKCTDWAAKGENTCRTCDTVQCRKQGDDELIVGSKKQSQCYPGHGDPPSDEELNQ